MKSPKDWEIILQMKDIEEIKKILNKTLKNEKNFLKKTISSLIISIISTFIATFLCTWLFQQEIKMSFWYFIIIVFIVILLTIVPFIKDIYLFLVKYEKCTKDEIIEKVDLFDNDIIYSVMLANKFFDYSEKNDISTSEKEFCLSETKYLIKKTVDQIESINIVSISDTLENCGYGSNKRIHKDRVIKVFKNIEYLLLKINDENFEKVIKQIISNIKEYLSIENENN